MRFGKLKLIPSAFHTNGCEKLRRVWKKKRKKRTLEDKIDFGSQEAISKAPTQEGDKASKNNEKRWLKLYGSVQCTFMSYFSMFCSISKLSPVLCSY